MNDNQRKAALLMHISSLPGKYGIGDMGTEARKVLDWMEQAGMRCWSVLPINPTSYGNSPYQAVSAFAGNYYFISPDELKKNRLLRDEDFFESDFRKEESIDYGKLFLTRYPLLKKAYFRFLEHGGKDKNKYKKFCRENAVWLKDYAAFMVCKEKNKFLPWWKWSENLAFRKEPEFSTFLKNHEEEMDIWFFIQFEFFEQWNALKKDANSRGIDIIGDMPFYVAPDSADVWAHPALFAFDPKNSRQTKWAGVPADDYTGCDRNWGNPVYCWDFHKRNDFEWFRQRIRMAAELYDGLRIDHAIGIMQYYAIQDGELAGRWFDGPGVPLADAISREAASSELYIIAEDLGKVPVGLREMLHDQHWYGMRLLQYAFTGKYGAKSSHLPCYHKTDMVVYTGTHDNCSLKEFLESLSAEESNYLKWWLKKDSKEELINAFIEEAYKSPANLVILPLQDILGLGEESRMSYPNDFEHSWLWRLSDFRLLEEKTAGRMKALAVLTGRFPFEEKEFDMYLRCLLDAGSIYLK